jgi:hypothetical protein
VRLAQFFAVILTALALIPGGAHLLELPNKIGLPQDQYFIVQGIYRGWALIGIVLIAALVANLVLAFIQRARPLASGLALFAALCMAATLATFFVWTFPANQATDNWTTVPADWETLRRQWEYSHAVNAVVTFIALCSVTLSVLAAKDE